MAPGLQKLDCKQCGAPIHPPAESTVVTCSRCGQPHMWVAPGSDAAAPRAPAPGEAGDWIARHPSPPPRASLRPLALIIGAGVALLVVIGVTAGAIYWRSSAPRRSAEAVGADVPLSIGDTVEYYRTPNDSCQSFVAALQGAGRVLVDGCGSEGGTSADRSQLVLETYQFRAPDTDDVALEKTASGWERVVVLGTDAGARVRVAPLLGGPEHSVGAVALRVVAPRSGAGATRWIPWPVGAPLEGGDVVSFRDGAMIEKGKVTRIEGEEVTLVTGTTWNAPRQLDPKLPAFQVDTTAIPVTRSRSSLLGELASALAPPAADRTLLVQHGGAWVRARIASAGEHGRWTVHGEGGSDSWVIWGGSALLLEPR